MASKLLILGKTAGLTTILNADLEINVIDLLNDIDYLIVNEHELEISLGIEQFDLDVFEECYWKVENINVKFEVNLVVTLGEQGVIAFIAGVLHTLPCSQK